MAHVQPGYKLLFDADFRKPFPNIQRYYSTMANQAKFAKVLGKFELCTKTMALTSACTVAAAPVQTPSKLDARAVCASGGVLRDGLFSCTGTLSLALRCLPR